MPTPANRPGEEASAKEAFLKWLLEMLITSIPTFAEWIAGIFSGNDSMPSVAEHVRKILPEKGRSEEVVEQLERELAAERKADPGGG